MSSDHWLPYFILKCLQKKYDDDESIGGFVLQRQTSSAKWRAIIELREETIVTQNNGKVLRGKGAI